MGGDLGEGKKRKTGGRDRKSQKVKWTLERENRSKRDWGRQDTRIPNGFGIPPAAARPVPSSADLARKQGLCALNGVLYHDSLHIRQDKAECDGVGRTRDAGATNTDASFCFVSYRVGREL
jgi:hypothetical protein